MWVYFYVRPQQNIFPEFLPLLQRGIRGDLQLTNTQNHRIPMLWNKSGAVFPTGRTWLHCKLRHPIARFRTTQRDSPTTVACNKQDGDCSPASMMLGQFNTLIYTTLYVLSVLFPPISSYSPESTGQEGPWYCAIIHSLQLVWKSNKMCFS